MVTAEKQTIRIYKLPLVESLSTFINHFYLSKPIFILSINFSSVEVGLYMIAYKTSSISISFFTTSFEKVFFRKYQKIIIKTQKNYILKQRKL
jgi:hypothetical protein